MACVREGMATISELNQLLERMQEETAADGMQWTVYQAMGQKGKR